MSARRKICKGWRRSLCRSSMIAVPLLSGCLISPPDKYDPLELVPPRVDMQTVWPTPFAYVATRSTGDDPVFTASFESEDLGVPVVGKLYLNLDTADEAWVGSAVVGPGSLGDERPPMAVPWQYQRERNAGCYVMTMTITHETNYDNTTVISKPKDTSKTAYITWWVAHDLDPQYVSFDGCPAPGPQPEP